MQFDRKSGGVKEKRRREHAEKREILLRAHAKEKRRGGGANPRFRDFFLPRSEGALNCEFK